jgi:hypothetical protein
LLDSFQQKFDFEPLPAYFAVGRLRTERLASLWVRRDKIPAGRSRSLRHETSRFACEAEAAVQLGDAKIATVFDADEAITYPPSSVAEL